MNKKKILVFIDWYLPGFKAGGPIRSCANLVAHLSAEFDFFIVTRDTDYMSTIPYPDVRKNEWNRLEDGSSVYYISADQLNSGTIKRLIDQSGADYYYLNGIFSEYFTQIPLKRISDKKKIIVSVRGMLAPAALSIKPLKKKIFFLYARLTGLYKGITFQAVSEEEKLQTEKIFPGSAIKIAPNLSRVHRSGKPKPAVKTTGEVRLISIARIAPEKNLLFALEILSRVKTKVIFDFYGPVYDAQYWSLCRKKMADMPAGIRATYKGVTGSADVFDILKGYHFLFMPSRTENFGHIILESLSSGLPVIISDQTPWRGLESARAGWDTSLDDSKSFVRILEYCAGMAQADYDTFSSGAFNCADRFINDPEKKEASRRLFS